MYKTEWMNLREKRRRKMERRKAQRKKKRRKVKEKNIIKEQKQDQGSHRHVDL